MIQNGLQCPYHGWTFNGHGACVVRPGVTVAFDNPEQHNSVQAFQVVEQHGLVWVCLSSLPATSSPRLQKWDDDPAFGSFLWKSQVNAELADALENLLDGTHTPFVHSGLVRSQGKAQRFSATVRVSEFCAEAEYLGEGKQNGWVSRLFERERQQSFGRFLPPCTAELEYRSSAGTEFVLNSHFTPAGPSKLNVFSRIYIRRTRVPIWVKRGLLTPFFRRILKQDQNILHSQQQNIAKFGGADFVSWDGDLLRGPIEHWLRTGRFPAVPSETTIHFEL